MVLDSLTMSRLGIAGIVRSQPDLQVCVETGDAALCRRSCGEWQPDLVLLDVDLRKGDAVAFLRQLSEVAPAAHALIVTALEDSDLIQRAMRAGARALISKYDEPHELLAGIRAVLAGEHFVSRRMAGVVVGLVAQGEARGPSPSISALSNREFEVFRLIGTQRGAKSIASDLGVSVRTIETHQARMKEKLRLKTCAELQALARTWRTRAR